MKQHLRQLIAGVGITASLIAGGAGIASAQDTTPTTTPAPATAAPEAQTSDQRTASRNAGLQEILAPLVAAGTINQTQADAVAKALLEKAPEGRGGPGGRRGPDGKRGGRHSATIAKALGMTEAELKAAHQSGKTIAQLTADNGVDLNKVIDAIVAEEKVEHPDRTEAEIREHVTNMVNGVKPTKPAKAQ